jgi:Gluconate 2-dehydrogenase subunit 3
VDRRALVQWMVAAGGLAAVHRLSAQDLLALGTDAHRAGAGNATRHSVLDAPTSITVMIAAEHIIPANTTPGATQANVTAFIDTMLDGWYPAPDRARFLRGIAELDARCMDRFGERFANSTSAQQFALLEFFDAEVTALRSTSDAAANEHWFAMLKYLTVWGYCTSEVGMRETLHSYPMPMRYDGNARVEA